MYINAMALFYVVHMYSTYVCVDKAKDESKTGIAWSSQELSLDTEERDGVLHQEWNDMALFYVVHMHSMYVCVGKAKDESKTGIARSSQELSLDTEERDRDLHQEWGY
jgi:hypothetical protein